MGRGDLAKRLGARILLVEDDREVRTYMSEALFAAGYELKTAEDGNEALEEIAADSRIALVISDLAMPGLSGIEFLKRAVYAHPNIRVMIATGTLDATANRELTEIGVTKLLVKPFDSEALLDSVDEALSDHLYDGGVLDCLRASIPNILATGSRNLEVRADASFLRSSSTMLGRLSACVEIGGADLCGKLVVSASSVLFSRMVKGWLGESTARRGALWDAIGELTNLVAAELMAHYSNRGLESFQSPALIVEGVEVRIGYMTDRLSLVTPFVVPELNATLYVEWILAAKTEKPFIAATPERPRPPSRGDIELF